MTTDAFVSGACDPATGALRGSSGMGSHADAAVGAAAPAGIGLADIAGIKLSHAEVVDCSRP